MTVFWLFKSISKTVICIINVPIGAESSNMKGQTTRRSSFLSRQKNVSQRTNNSSVTETDSHLLSLPAPFFRCIAIGYSMFSHGGLNRSLDMKSPPPLNLCSENLRVDAANQGVATSRVNHSCAVSSCCYNTLCDVC